MGFLRTTEKVFCLVVFKPENNKHEHNYNRDNEKDSYNPAFCLLVHFFSTQQMLFLAVNCISNHTVAGDNFVKRCRRYIHDRTTR